VLENLHFGEAATLHEGRPFNGEEKKRKDGERRQYGRQEEGKMRETGCWKSILGVNTITT